MRQTRDLTDNSAVGLARQRLAAYCSLTNANYKVPAHLAKIARALEKVESGEITRLIITIPPRHGKSMMCSTYFPAWYLGRNPARYIITSTYGQDLSDGFGRRVREQIQSPLYQHLFPLCKLDKGTQAANRMETTLGGSYYGVGAQGPITGRGGHLILCDDMVKNREEADSEIMRDKLYDWYRSVLYTRLMPGGALVVIMTRWHEDDLVGRLLRDQAHENWTLINMPAMTDGKALWPEQYSAEDMERIRATLNEYDWQCVYQQDPIPPDGIIVRPDWIKSGLSDDPHGYTSVMIGVDPAIGQKDFNDETAITVVGVCHGERPRIDEIETVSGHWTFDQQIRFIEMMQQKHKAILVGVEDVAYQAALVQELARRGCPVCAVKTGGKDKVARLMGVSHMMTQGRVRINTKKLHEQLLKFRGGSERNDCVDAFVNALVMVRDYTVERLIDTRNDDLKRMDPVSAQIWGMERAFKEMSQPMGGAWGQGSEDFFNPHEWES